MELKKCCRNCHFCMDWIPNGDGQVSIEKRKLVETKTFLINWHSTVALCKDGDVLKKRENVANCGHFTIGNQREIWK